MRRILALFVLVLFSAMPALAADLQKGDNLFGVTYFYGARDVEFNQRATSFGVNYERFIVGDFSVEVGAFWPKAQPGQSSFSGNAGINYHFGPFYIPIQGIYRGVTDDLAVASGMGINFMGGPVNLRFAAMVDYALNTGYPDKRTSYRAEGALRFRF